MIVGVLGTLMALAVTAISLATLQAARNEALEHAHDTSGNVTSVLVSNIERTFETSNNALLTLIAAWQNPAVQSMNSAVRHKIFFNSTPAEYLTGAGVTDSKGRLIDGCCGTSHRWNFSDRDYFVVQRESANAGLYLSSPYRARSRSGVEAIALSRRINQPDGSFGGVVMVAIDLAYFRQLLSTLDVGPHGITAVVRTDGTVIARNPPLSTAQTITSATFFSRMANHDSGFYAARSSIDGTVRLYTFQRIPGTPLIAVVAPAETDILAGSRRMTWMVGVSTASIGIAFCVVVWLLAFALGEHVKTQVLLTELTQTDPLTGIKNRRALDEFLENEWERLRRNDSCLSVLFIDADHFKQYNDSYGHAQGDLALKHLAACIRQHAIRRGDLTARYGGEEFVVVLPDTDETGAAQVAEAIRHEVENGSIDNSGTLARFTVSIGCATGRRAHPRSLAELTNNADSALYAAKRGGRNAVVSAEDQLQNR
ncbi:sensor domain-containing diguanylate cyclase [Paraburkholderia sp. BCC1876]|uniref:sensor domain-containing diguanylate cyclase n=1 Tax=Paraburkholderia sp. BCC1876 TaxID=2676303 RepID=UPI0015908FED|nr:sensor domain-containing diguanylate cyclase [Paraburkholderia sp. BCC1876]